MQNSACARFNTTHCGAWSSYWPNWQNGKCNGICQLSMQAQKKNILKDGSGETYLRVDSSARKNWMMFYSDISLVLLHSTYSRQKKTYYLTRFADKISGITCSSLHCERSLSLYTGISLAFFLSLLDWLVKNKSFADKILFVWLLVIAERTLVFTFLFPVVCKIIHFLIGCNFLFHYYGPFLYLYAAANK